MVKIVFARNAKTIEVLEDVYSKEEAQAIAEQNRGKAFGMFSGLMKAFEKNKRPIVLSGYHRRYEPFWHLTGESVQEYKRRTHYNFGVRPEVRSVMFNGKVITADENLTCHFDGEDHCYEHYTKEIRHSAVHDKERGLDRYMGAKRKTIRALASVQDRETVIEPINIRASFLVNNAVKDLIKPIQADKIIQEVVQINRLALLLRPVHVFEFREEGSDAGKSLEVDAVTGEVRKAERMSYDTKKHLVSEGMFELGSEIAATVIPGAGVAAVIGKQLKQRQERRHDIKQMKEWRKAYDTQKKKK